MESMLLIAVLAGLGGMAGWGLADFFAKKTIDQIGDTVSLAWGHIFGTVALVVTAVYQFGIRGQQLTLPTSWQAWVGLLFFGTLQAIVYFLVYKGFGKGQVGVLSPVFASFSGLTALISLLIGGEVLGPYALLGLVALFVGIMLVNLDVSALRARRISFARLPGFKEVAIATLLATIWTLSWDRFVGGHDWLVYVLLMYLFMTAAILISTKAQRLNLLVVTPSLWKFLVLIGVCETAAFVAISVGYSVTTFTSVVALLSGAFSLPTIILARLFLKEKITSSQVVGSLIIIAGIMILAVV